MGRYSLAGWKNTDLSCNNRNSDRTAGRSKSAVDVEEWEKDRDLRPCALCSFAGTFDVHAVAPSVVQLAQLHKVKHLKSIEYRDLTGAFVHLIERLD